MLMRNIQEHEKLLAQVAELEKNSVNYFDIEKEFFLIDSDNLSEVKTRFYGYSIQSIGIYEDDNLTQKAVQGLDGRGCYVYVESANGEITIKQDLNGSYGIYLFRQGDYFALSNSFFRLVDHVKFRQPLTVNLDICNYLFVETLYVNTCSETAINEIQILDRCAICHIDIAKKYLEIEFYNYQEHTIATNSKESIQTLDNWMDLWRGVFQGLSKSTKFISVDLTGGFDSRVAFIPLLNSGVDLNQIRINTTLPNHLYTHDEDYAIATKIADYYGCKLNQPSPNNPVVNYSLSDIFNLNLYCKQLFTSLPTFSQGKKINKTFGSNGFGGEGLKTVWSYVNTSDQFILARTQYALSQFAISQAISQKLSKSISKVLKTALSDINIRRRPKDDVGLLLQYFSSDVYLRYHFGKAAVSGYFQGGVSLSPILDPLLRKVNYKTEDFSDYNLLMALIYTRYRPELLQFPFNNQKFIHPETLAYAQKINDRFPPYVPNKDNITDQTFDLQPRNLQAEKILEEGKNNPAFSEDLPEACLKAVFESSKTYGLFTTHFDSEIFNCVAAYYDNPNFKFTRHRPMFSAVGVARVLEDVQISQQNKTPYRDMQRFLLQDYCKIDNVNNAVHAEIGRKFLQKIAIEMANGKIRT